MKILHLISGGDTGGAKTHVISLLKELQKHIDVQLVCFMEGEFSKDARRACIDIQIFEQKSRIDFAAIKQLINKIKNEKYDIIHSHGARANFISAILKIFLDMTVITTIHSDYKLDDFLGNYFKNVLFRKTNAISLRLIDYFIGVSDNFKEMLIHRGFPEEKIFSVYNGIDFNETISYRDRKDFLKQYDIGYKEEEILIGIMARLDPVKGIKVFLEGASKAYTKNKNLRFLIAGEGEEKQKLKRYSEELGINDITHFLGFVSNPYDFFNAIDINTLTSYSESFPFVILEGARMKKTAISTSVGGIKDMICHGETGYLFNVGDSDALGRFLVKLAVDEKQRIMMGEKFYTYVKKHFSTETMAAKHIEIYREVIKRKG